MNVSDHVHVHKTVLPGPHGQQFVTMTVTEDIDVQGVMRKNEFDEIEKASGIGSSNAAGIGTAVNRHTTGSKN